MEYTVNIHAAKTHLSRLVERAEAGEEIIIARAGRPVAKLVPLTPKRPPRRLGALKGEAWIAPDFDDLPQDILAAFQGDGPLMSGPAESERHADAPDGKK